MLTETCHSDSDSTCAPSGAGRSVVDRLSESQLYRDYEQAFRAATGLPLAIRPVKAYENALKSREGGNPFCMLLAQTNAGCANCIKMQADLEQKAGLEPKSLHCFAGLCDSAVPIRVGGELIAFLQTGQILLHQPNQQEFSRITKQLIAWGSEVNLKALEEAVGRATEMGKSVLFVPGISDLDQVETITGLNILGHVAEHTAKYETSLNVPVSKSIVMEAARDICKASYLKSGRPDLYSDDMVHYISDEQFAYAAGVNGIMMREKPAACFYLGKFYAESLILAEAGNSIGAIQIAGTGSYTQIPFFVTACDYTLIGEEFFVASAYLSKKPELVGSIKGQDIVKLLVMIAIALTVVLNGFFQSGWISFDILSYL